MATLLSSLSDELAATVASADRGVVRVEGRRRLSGSGIVWSAEGVVVTAHHVLERDENIIVGLPEGQGVQATLVGRDATTDIAVLRIFRGTADRRERPPHRPQHISLAARLRRNDTGAHPATGRRGAAGRGPHKEGLSRSRSPASAPSIGPGAKAKPGVWTSPDVY